MSSKKLNKQQREAVEWGEGPLLIIAGAGTGKTTVVTERIKHLVTAELAKTSEILALTFTEKAAREMEERVDLAMPYGYTDMWISTFHGFCDRILRDEALQIGRDPRYRLMNQTDATSLIRENLFDFDLNYFRPLGNPNKFIGGLITHISRLQDEDVSVEDYEIWAKKMLWEADSEEEKMEAEKWVELSAAYKKYEEIKAEKGVMDFGDLIVKSLELFGGRPNVLEKYRERFKYILVDEFQDTNYAQNELAMSLARESANITVCGDDDQCLPAGAKIDTPEGSKKISDISVGDEVVTAVGKGYLSCSKVLHVNKVKKSVRFLTFVTESGKRIQVTDNHKMFCMIPGREFGSFRIYYVYMMWRQNMGWRLGITNDLAQRLKLERSADKIVAIKSCSSIEEARFFETVFSMKYQIPTYPFKPRKKMLLTGEWLEKLYSQFDTENNAQRLANDLGIDLNARQYCLDGVVRGVSERIKILLKMNVRRHRTKWARDRYLLSPKICHQVHVESSSNKAQKLLKDHGVATVKAKKGWRIRREFADLKEAGDFARKIENLLDGILEVRFHVGKRDRSSRPALVMPASNVFVGMHVPVRKGYQVIYERVVEKIASERRAYVYDLEVDKTHNFIADGIVVHNSIYRFRGAAVSNIMQFRERYPEAKVVTLTKNYRSSQEILDRAYELIVHNNPDRLEVSEKVDKRLVASKGEIGEGVGFAHLDRVENEAEFVSKKINELKDEGYQWSDFAVLIRANNHSQPFVQAFQRSGVPYQFLGPGRLFSQAEVMDLVAYLKVMDDPQDSVSLYRVMSMNGMGFGGVDLAKLNSFARRRNLSMFEALEKVTKVDISEEAKERAQKFLEVLRRHLALVPKESAGQILYYFLEDMEMLPKLLNPSSSEAEKRAANISKFFDKLKSFEVDREDSSVSAIVDWIDLSSEIGESPLASNTDWVGVNAANILTVHSSKGLEFPVVFLVNLVSARFPPYNRQDPIPIPEELIKETLPAGDYHMQEERRLFYVGMTRAMDRLFLTAADYYGEGKREKKLSPFIFEALGKDAQSSELDTETRQLSFLDYGESVGEKKSREVDSGIHIDYLSYSQIQTFEVCPLHYKLDYLVRVPKFPTAALSMGSSVHAALRDFYASKMRGEKMSKKAITSLLEDNWINLGYKTKKHEQKAMDKAREQLEKYYEEQKGEAGETIGVEQSFVVPLPGKSGERRLKIGGKIDRMVDLGGRVEIIDYKTGERVPNQREVDKNMQLGFYALAATLIPHSPFGKKPSEVKLSLYYLEEQEKISTTWSAKDLSELMDEIYKKRKEIEESDFKCSKGYLCQNCEYGMFCGED